MNMGLILSVIGGVLFESASQYFFTEAIHKHLPYFNSFALLGVLSTIMAAFMYYGIIKHGWQMAKANIIWEGMVTLLVAIIGYIRFQQSFTHRQIVGMITIFVGMIIIG